MRLSLANREAYAAFEFYAQVNARLLVLVIAVTFGTAASSSERRGLVFGESKTSPQKIFVPKNLALNFASCLTTQAETSDDLVITLDIYALEVVQQTSALRDHLEQTAPRVVIFLMRPEVLGQFVNALAEQSDLHLW
jgi:hypothetical protein